MDELKRFLKFVLVMDNGCHEWQSVIHRDGYGKFYFRGKQIQAHRVSYQLQVGEIPEKLYVCHTCDNRKCVNPLHLYVGTPKQNCKDRAERCNKWGNTKTPFETVQECKRLYTLGWSQQKIANHFKINQPQVSRYIKGKQRAFK